MAMFYRELTFYDTLQQWGTLQSYWPLTDGSPSTTNGSIADRMGNDTDGRCGTWYTSVGVGAQQAPGAGYTAEPSCMTYTDTGVNANRSRMFGGLTGGFTGNSANFGYWINYPFVAQDNDFNHHLGQYSASDTSYYRMNYSTNQARFQAGGFTSTDTAITESDFVGGWKLIGMTEHYTGTDTIQELFVNGVSQKQYTWSTANYGGLRRGTGTFSFLWNVDSGQGPGTLKMGVHFYITGYRMTATDWLAAYNAGK